MPKPFFTSFRQALSLVRQDPMIILPGIIILMTLHFCTTFFLTLFHITPEQLVTRNWIGLISASQWIIDLVINGLFVIFVMHLAHSPKIDFRQAAIDFIQIFPRLFAVTFPIGIAFVGLIWISFPTSELNIEALSPLRIVGFVCAGVLSLILNFLPPLIILNNSETTPVVKEFWRVIKTHYGQLALFGFFAFNFSLAFLLVSLLFSEIPAIGEPVLSVVIQGTGFGIVYLAWIKFYEGLRTTSVSLEV